MNIKYIVKIMFIRILGKKQIVMFRILHFDNTYQYINKIIQSITWNLNLTKPTLFAKFLEQIYFDTCTCTYKLRDSIYKYL